MISRISSPKMGVFGFSMAQNGNGAPSPSPSPAPAPSIDPMLRPFPGFVPTYPQPFYNFPVDVAPSTGIPTWGWILGIGVAGVIVGTLLAK